MSRLSALGLVGCAGTLLVGTACDLDQSFLFPAPIDAAPGVQDLGSLEPIELTTPEDVREQVIYGEIGPTGTAELGGLSFDFEGIGGSVCVWIDPELVWWNQSVSPSKPIQRWTAPDNVFDDGDLDLTGGLSVYYTGTPGASLGDFEVRYEDDLGNVVPIDLVECFQTDYFGTPAGHAGRAYPEWCTIDDTLVGVNYTVVLGAFSTPLDDDRLGYGLLLTKGRCEAGGGGGGGGGIGGGAPSTLREFLGANSTIESPECVIRGESIVPGHEQGDAAAAAGLPSPTWLGSERPSWKGSEAFEKAYCEQTLPKFCRDERRAMAEAGKVCSWELPPLTGNEAEGERDDVRFDEGGSERCYCGNPADTPDAGAL